MKQQTTDLTQLTRNLREPFTKSDETGGEGAGGGAMTPPPPPLPSPYCRVALTWMGLCVNTFYDSHATVVHRQRWHRLTQGCAGLYGVTDVLQTFG